jgi:hypothetical protein
MTHLTRQNYRPSGPRPLPEIRLRIMSHRAPTIKLNYSMISKFHHLWIYLRVLQALEPLLLDLIPGSTAIVQNNKDHLISKPIQRQMSMPHSLHGMTGIHIKRQHWQHLALLSAISGAQKEVVLKEINAAFCIKLILTYLWPLTPRTRPSNLKDGKLKSVDTSCLGTVKEEIDVHLLIIRASDQTRASLGEITIVNPNPRFQLILHLRQMSPCRSSVSQKRLLAQPFAKLSHLEWLTNSYRIQTMLSQLLLLFIENPSHLLLTSLGPQARRLSP